MKVALVVFEMTLNSYDHGIVYGEEMDARGIQKAFLRRKDVECCDILSINLIRFLESRGEMKEYDLAIHFALPTIQFTNAINILFFQQFYEWEKHDMNEYLKNFDYVMTCGRAICDWYKDVIYFPLAVDMEFYKKQKVNDEYTYDVVFVGNRKMRDLDTYNRYLMPAFDYNLAIYGAEWDVEGFEKYVKYYKGLLPYDDAPKVYASSKVSLCIHNRDYLEKFQLVTTRGFHAISCGGFVISDPIPEMMNLLPQGKGVIYTNGGDELCKAFKEYIYDDDARKEIVDKGYNWILSRHTWDHRVEELLSKISFKIH